MPTPPLWLEKPNFDLRIAVRNGYGFGVLHTAANAFTVCKAYFPIPSD